MKIRLLGPTRTAPAYSVGFASSAKRIWRWASRLEAWRLGRSSVRQIGRT